jgi:hypothetical protein
MATNTHLFTGLDGSISLAAVQGTAEGDAAKPVIASYQLAPVGRATGVTVQVTSQITPFHEIGKRYASELRPGNVDVSGNIGRAYINGALLSLMLAKGAATPEPSGSFLSPAFNMTLHLSSLAFPNNSSVVTVYNLMFDTWGLALPEDDFVLENATFKALWIAVVDKATQ